MFHHIAITGASGAIGGALARAMRAAWPDAELALVDYNAEAAAHLAHELGGATAYGADLRDIDALPQLVERLETNGPLDGLVNCAGVMKIQSAATWNWSVAHDLLKLDLISPLRLQDLVVRGMVEREHGLIVNIASMAGRVPLRGGIYYGASKAGLGMASEISRADLAPHGVQVITVYPGPIKSALEAGARADYGGGGLFGRFAPTGDPVELTRKIMTAIKKNQARVIYPRLYQAGWAATNIASWFALSYGPPPIS